MPRKEFFGGNWKMHHTLKSALIFFRDMPPEKKGKEIVFFPPFPLLLPLKDKLGDSFRLGAQNCFYEEQGAFTGEVSAWMLAEEKIPYVIIGHSERRSLFGETDEIIRKKTEAALRNGLKPVICVGETLEQRDKNRHFKIIENQLAQALRDIDLPSAETLIVAYEPVWAIGTSRTASPAQAQEMHAWIRKNLQSFRLPSQDIRIIYGGSVKPSNIAELMACPDIDGALVGGASLNPKDFASIVHWEK